MNTEELIYALEQRYGNPYAAKEMVLIQEAIKVLQFLLDDNNELRKQVNE